MNNTRANSWGILPLLVIVFCNMLSFFLIRDICRDLCSTTAFSDGTHSFLKFFLSPALNIAVAGLLLYAAKTVSVYRIVQRTYISITLVVASLFFVIAPIYGQPAEGEHAVWIHGLFYLLSALWAPLTFVLFYGYFNNIVTFSRACKLYPALSIFSLLLTEFVMPNIRNSIASEPALDRLLTVGLISVACLLTTMYCFYRTNLKATDEKGPQEKSFGLVFFISLIVLTATVGFAQSISVITWDFSIMIKNSYPSSYWEVLEGFSALRNLSVLLAVVLLGFLSVYLKQNKMAGWRNFCYLSTGLITLLVATMIFLNIMSGSIGAYLVNGDTSLFDKLLTSVGGSYQVFIATVFYPTLLCLKHLVFVPIPFKDRFRTKVIVDLVFYKAGYFVVVLLQGSLLPFSDFKAQLMFILAFCFIVVLLLRVLCINYVSKKLEPVL